MGYRADRRILSRMRYRCHFQNMGGGLAFGIVVDDEALTWESDPPGNELPKPFAAYFSREGAGNPIGSGKRFEVMPGGRARPVN